MNTPNQKVVSLRVSETDYAKLEQAAAGLGLKPAVLARVLVRAGLNAPSNAPRKRSRKDALAALDRLDRFVASGRAPAVDVVELIRQAREERDDQLMHTLNRRPPR